ncbi:MAG: SPOR domain-containing protein [Pseudomonadota bacterium]
MTTASEAIDENYDDEDEGGLSGFWILIIFLVVLAAFAGIVYIAYQKGMHAMASNEHDLPVVAADPSPVREEVALDPVEPTRQEVFDELNDVTPTRVVADIDPAADPLANFDEVDSAPVTPTPARVAEVTPAAPSPSVTPPQPQPQATVPTQRPVSRSVPQQAAVPSSATGTHVVQVGAFGSNAEAMEQYGALVQKHGNLVGNHAPDVQQASVKGRTYHRLRLAGFSSRANADQACQRLTAAGTDCFVKAR